MSIVLKQQDLVEPMYLGIPYLLNGRTVEGIDCLGLILLWLRNKGIDIQIDEKEVPLNSDWWRSDPNKYIKGALRFGDVVPLRLIRANDVVLFSLANKQRVPNHGAVMVNSGWFLHIMTDGVSRVDCFDTFWRSRLAGIIRVGSKELLEPGQEERIR